MGRPLGSKNKSYKNGWPSHTPEARHAYYLANAEKWQKRANLPEEIARKKEYQQAHLVNFRSYRRKSVYGLTDVAYQEMIKEQNNQCYICHADLVRPAIDHDHITGKVRALLCHACNIALGHYEGKKEALNMYLARFV